jgi:hypothetical protein
MRFWFLKLGGVLFVTLIVLITHSIGLAQETEFELQLLRTFGFQAGLQVQGSFSARITGPEDLERVTLYLDGGIIGVDETEPFRIDFNTGDYPAGEHRLWAEGETLSGEVLRSPYRRLIFLTTDESFGTVSNYLLPIFALIGFGIVFSYVMMARGGKKEHFRLGEYGAVGGAVCRRCGLPFSRHVLAPNLLLGKLERCPHCGRWVIAARASTAALEQAECHYAADVEKGSYRPVGAEDDLFQRIEDSRFED